MGQESGIAVEDYLPFIVLGLIPDKVLTPCPPPKNYLGQRVNGMSLQASILNSISKTI